MSPLVPLAVLPPAEEEEVWAEEEEEEEEEDGLEAEEEEPARTVCIPSRISARGNAIPGAKRRMSA
jgi:hypothetical protein